MKKQFLKSLTIAGAVAAVFSSPMVMADSAKVLFTDNGHYYQEFNTLPKLWNEAKKECENKGAHLVTITTKAENDFLTFVFKIDPWTWIGGRFQSGKWSWVTGEPFGLNYILSNQPIGLDTPYLAQSGNWDNGGWYSGSDYSRNYACEWEPKTYTSVLGLPDLNSNGSSESAALYIDTKINSHNVVIKDSDTQATLKTIVFDTKNVTPPIAMAQVSDMNANGAPEIAVMYWTKKSGAIGPMIGLMLKDALTGVASRSEPIKILSSQYKAISLSSAPDMTGDGINELEVLVMKYKDSSVSSQIINPVTGAVVKVVNF